VELVIEKFTITNETAKKSRQYDALNIIGVFRHYSYMSDWPLTLQSPGSAKKLGTDDRLKDLGWYTPGKGHANDAARHLLLYCVNNEIITFVDDRPVFIWRRFFASGLCNASALSRKNPPGKYETW
jgi:hypothetical protein